MYNETIFLILLFIFSVLLIYLDILTAVLNFMKNKKAFFKIELEKHLCWNLEKYPKKKAINKTMLAFLYIYVLALLIVYPASMLVGISFIDGLWLYLLIQIFMSILGILSNVFGDWNERK